MHVVIYYKLVAIVYYVVQNFSWDFVWLYIRYVLLEGKIPHSGKFWWGEYWRISFIQKFDMENIDRWSLRQPVFVIQLENIERENFDGLIAKHQIRQYFPRQYSPVKISCYMVPY